MSKGASDLDVFRNLADKNGDSVKSKAPPPAPMRQKTLVGMQAPAIPSRAPAPAGSMPPPPPSRRSTPPPPSSKSAGPQSPRAFPSAPPPPPQASGKGVNMDWDDEDEKTTVYDKAGGDDAPQSSLLGSGPSAPLPAAGVPMSKAPPVSRPLGPPPPSHVPAPTRPVNRPPAPPSAPMAVPLPGPMPGVVPTAPAGSVDRRTLAYAAVALLAVIAAAVFLLLPRSGSLIVTVSGPGNKPLDSVEIFLNGELKCSSSPCTVSGLPADTYMLRANAVGYQPMADTAVAVQSAHKAVHNLTLQRAAGTGIKVIAEGTGLKLFVDGKEVGPLPQELKDMEPGDHVIKVAGNDRYEPYEKQVTVDAEHMQTIGPLKLKVVKGLASIVPGQGAEDARVLLVSGNDRRTLPQLPINLDIPTNKPHTIIATKAGFESFRKPITFEDGKAEKTFEVTLAEEAGAGSAGASEAPSRSAGGGRRTGGGRAAPEPVVSSSGSGTLNINSIPVSNIILDGRPLGPTPKVGVRVSAGAHTVVFVSGTDRKSASVSVPAGQTKTIAVRF